MDYRADFFNFGEVSYLNCASHGPFPRETTRAIEEAMWLKTRPDRIRDEIYFRIPNEIRAELAALFGGAANDYAVTNGASDGVFAVARGLAWERGDEVLVGEGDFPANYFTWANLAPLGVKLRVLSAQDGRVSAAEFVSALGRHTRVVSVSLVNYNTGYRIDVDKLGAACRENGTLLVLDVSQAAGAIPLRLGGSSDSWTVDVATCCGYKWLLSPYGTGFAWFHPDVVPRLHVTDVYWQSVEGAEDFNRLPREGWKLAPGARRFDSVETASYLNSSAMLASLRYLRKVGVDTVERHAGNLLDRLLERIPPGLRVESSLEPRERSTVLTVSAGDPAVTRAAYERLRSNNVVVSLRENRIRISPNVYNNEEDIERLSKGLWGGPPGPQPA